MKTLFTIPLTVLTFWAAAQAPANDDCGGIIDLGVIPFCSAPAQYTNVNATASNISVNDNVPACFNNGTERDVWFQFTIPADGSIVDVEISVFGNVDGNGTMQMPQVAIYRGDCTFEGLAELDCAAAPLNVNEVHLPQFGLTPGIPYYLRINDYSATAAPNAGTFRLCVEEYVAEVNMGEVPGTQSCSGTLWDSGGPTGDYQSGENLTFSICPQDFQQCIVITVEEYNTEQGYDFIRFYQGDDISGIELTQISGSGQGFEVQVSGDCATIQFDSDATITDEGFQITWACSPNPCTTPPLVTCDDPVAIPSLPFQSGDLDNCFSGNSIEQGPCGNDFFLEGNDYVFTYTSPGDECIQFSAATNGFDSGVGIYDACPDAPGANCIGTWIGGFSPVTSFLENPGTYYLVFASEECTPFNLSVNTVTCPVVLPTASTCDVALNIGGCSTTLPQIISLAPGQGDPTFIQQGVNQGCLAGPQQNYSFFYFVAGEDGKFGFAVQAADPNEASDIDFNVWGPVPSIEEICEYTANNQPVRSSWAAGADLTGLADIHPELGTPVTDEFDCGSINTPGAAGDDFVSMLDVQEGEIYVILLDDFGSAIEQSGISIDFSTTTEGVLEGLDTDVQVSADTTICPGQPVQLNASGGVTYIWNADPTLSCINCPNPIATPTVSTVYQVSIATTCSIVSREVDVKVVDLNLGPNVTVCTGASFTLNENGYQDAQYAWTGGPTLSCTDCPSPQVSGLEPGVYLYTATLTTPFCTDTDTLQVIVLPGQQPQYNIADDYTICIGESVTLGGPAVPGTTYQWSSIPTGFNSNAAAPPSLTPTVSTVYYLTASNNSCPIPTIDSVVVDVYQSPILAVQGDTTLCEGQSVVLGTTTPEAGITYTWTPDDGSLDNANAANPLATPTTSTVYTLTASNPGCTETRTLTVAVVPIALDLNVPDSVMLCKGEVLNIQAFPNPPSTVVNWSPFTSLIIGSNGQNVTATPEETITYTASVTVAGGCSLSRTVRVQVDSLPANLDILPSDTTICLGEKVLLVSPIYEPAEYMNIEFLWIPGEGQLTPDTLYNLVAQPTDTIVYQRISISGACIDTAQATVNVIVPPDMKLSPADTSVCVGQSVVLSLSNFEGVENIMWTPASTLSCSMDCVTSVATPTGSTTYSVNGTYEMCPVSASAVVNVTLPPPYQFPDDVQLCGGDSIRLNLISDPTATYLWTSLPPGFTSNEPQPTVAPAQTTTYILQATNGCSTQAQLTVTVSNATLQVSNDTTICEGFSTLLTAAGTLPGNYTWSDGQTGQAVVVTPAQTSTYTVTYTFGQDCQLTDEVVVTIQGQSAQVTFPTDVELCPGESVVLNSTATPGATYTWASTPPGFTSNQAIPPAITPSVTTTYNVTATLGNCVRTQSVTITVYNATLSVSADTTLCAGESVTLFANGSVTGDYLWTPGGTQPSFLVTPAQTTTYDLLYTYGDNCTIEESVQVTVVPNFMVNIVADPDTNRINAGESIALDAVLVPSQSTNGFQFQWFENGTTSIGSGQQITATPATTDSTIFYLVQVTSPFGCEQEAVIDFVVVQPKVRIPNAFTPNGDQDNSTFGIVVLEGIAVVERLEIYNRWGQKIFESTDPNARWDGNIDGKPAPVDVYVYNVRWRRGDGALELAHGEVTLLR